MICPPATLLKHAGAAAKGSPCRHRRPGLPRRNQRRLHRRHLGRNAGRRRGDRRHRRPFRAADHPQGDRRAGARQGARRLAGRADRRSSASARPRRNGKPAKRSTCWAGSSTARCRTRATGANLVVAYEPVWAIGTGLTPTLADVAQAHGFIRRRLAERYGTATAQAIRILYGGSVKASNARELMASCQRRRRAGRGRQPQGRRVSGDCRGLSLNPRGVEMRRGIV